MPHREALAAVRPDWFDLMLHPSQHDFALNAAAAQGEQEGPIKAIQKLFDGGGNMTSKPMTRAPASKVLPLSWQIASSHRLGGVWNGGATVGFLVDLHDDDMRCRCAVGCDEFVTQPNRLSIPQSFQSVERGEYEHARDDDSRRGGDDQIPQIQGLK